MSAIEYQPRARAALAVAAVASLSLLHATAHAQSGKNRVRALTHETSVKTVGDAPPGTTTIRIRGSATPTFTVYKLERPERVIIDLANAVLDQKLTGNDASVNWLVNSWSVSSVASHSVAGSDRSTVRVIVHLARSASYDVQAQGRDLVIVITPHESAPAGPVDADAERALAETRARVLEAEKAADKARQEAQKARAEAEQAEKKARANESGIADAQRTAREREAALRDAEKKHQEALREAAKRESELREVEKRHQEALRRADQHEASLRAVEKKHENDLRQAAQRESELRAQATREAELRVQAEKQAQESRRQAEREAALRQDAEQRARVSREAAERATREADEAKKTADARARQAEERMSAANAVMQAAEVRLASAEQMERDARQAERDAEAARQSGVERQREAMQAANLAAERLAEAKRAQQEARTYLEQASQAQGDETKARALRERAEQAAREAEEHRVRAEKAAKEADQTRLAAEQAARVATERLQESVTALERAKKERSDAEAARAEADSQRRAAEAARKQAENLRAGAEAEAREASERAARAQALRQTEEAAYAKIVDARKHAAEGQRAQDAASQRLASAERAADQAQAHLEKVRKDTAEVNRHLAELSKQTHAGENQVSALERQAKELAAERTRAERELATRRAEVESSRGALKQLEQTLAKKTAELAAVEDAATQAKAAREREERLLAQISERRAQAERALLEAEKKRAQAQEQEQAARLAEQQLTATRVAQARTGGQSKRSKKSKPVKPPGDSKPTRDSGSVPAALAPQSGDAGSAGDKQAEAGTSGQRGGSAQSSAAQRTLVQALEFVDQQRVSRIKLDFSGPAQPRLVTPSGRRVVLEIQDSELPREFERTLDASRFNGPIKTVSSYRDLRNPSTVRVVVDLARPVKSKLTSAGAVWYWDFDKNRAEITAASADASPRQIDATARKAAPERDASSAGASFGVTSAPITQQTVAQLDERRRKVYRGTKMDLDFKDADIHNLLRTLANVGGVNIVIPDEIQARVTVRLRRVPWDQALEVILASKGLWYKREGDLYRIATRKQLDAEAEAEAARLAALVKSEAPEPQIFTLNYAVADKVKEQLTPLLSPKGRIEVDTRTNSLIINDIRANRRRIIDLLTRLDTQTPQVQIEARVVEARSDFAREIGIQWGGNAGAGGGTTGLDFPSSVIVRGGNDSPGAPGVAPAPTDFAVNLPANVGPGAGGAIGLALGSIGGNFNLSLRLSALEDAGSVRIISAPKITVLDNVKAEISQGVSIPISVISANGVQTTFVNADLSLKVTPHVSQRDCSVQMELHVEKNEADFVNLGARGDPTILRKEAKTTILVADGETTVIGGIYTRNTGLAYSKVPFLGDLPVFGWLFKSRRENDNRSEVLVFITPKITNKGFLRCE